MAAATLGSRALAQEGSSKSATYKVQLAYISVQAPRSSRTNYAAMSVHVGETAARTVRMRIGDVGRGTKALNISLSNVVLTPQTQLRITWAVVNYGGERHDSLMRAVGEATEEQTYESWMTQLSEAVSDVLVDRKKSATGRFSRPPLRLLALNLAVR